jgi:hypothetical protein
MATIRPTNKMAAVSEQAMTAENKCGINFMQNSAA